VTSPAGRWMMLAAARVVAAAAVVGPPSASTVLAQENGASAPRSGATELTVSGIEERLAELDQQIRILKRLRELERDSAAAKAKNEATATAGRQGFLIRSADGRFQLRLGGNVQADGRVYASDGVPSLGNTFLLRRVRPILEVTAYRVFEARVMPDFAEGRVQLQDAYVGARLLPGIQIRAGKFKGPVSLERLQSQTDLLFIERAFPSGIAPNRDLGVSLGGDLFAGRVRYDVGLFDGAVDGGSTDGDAGDNKDGEARLFVTPFARSGGLLAGLGFGVAGTLGEEHGSLTAPALAFVDSLGDMGLSAEQVEAMRSSMPQPEDVALVTVFLATPEGRRLSGRLLTMTKDELSVIGPPDGGRCVRAAGERWGLEELGAAVRSL